MRVALRPVLLAVLLAAPLHAQDTIPVLIDPDAPPLPHRAGPPAELLRLAVTRYNDSAATRLFGSFTVGSGTWVRGDLGMYRGTLRIAGRVTGRITILNGSLIVEGTGALEGDVLLLGGRYQVLPGGQHTGAVQAHDEAAPVYRNTAGLLEVRERPPSLGELPRAEAVFHRGQFRAALSLELGGTYNRVEGLPLRFGPTFSVTGPAGDQIRLDVRAIFRTETDPTKRRDPFGFRSALEYERREPVRLGLGVDYTRQVEAIESQPLSPGEVGWSTFLLGRDWRDYYESRGGGIALWAYPVRWLRLAASARHQEEHTIPAGDPLSVFRDADRWRPNPLVDDGRFTLIRFDATLDTRNSPTTPTSGWLVSAGIERGRSGDVAPVALPTDVRAPLPTQRSYRFTRAHLDARVYQRINAETRVNLRAVGAGWVGGDPLPIQRRVSVGGLDLMPGYGFRSQTCAPPAWADPARPALCDRSLVFQAEVRHRFRIGLRDQLGETEWMVFQRLLGADQADLVLFADAGKGWLSGDGPGRVPHGRLPRAREWDYDAGVGLDLEGIALFLASPTDRFAPRFTVRLQRRF